MGTLGASRRRRLSKRVLCAVRRSMPAPSHEFKKLVENARKKLDRKLDSDELHTGKNIPETREFSILSCPLEHYLQFSDEYRLAKLNDVIHKGSIIIGRVSSIGSNWVILDPIHVQGKRNRKIYDLDLEIHIPILDFHKELPKESDFLRAVVTSTTYKQEKYKIFASVNKSLVPSSISLGPYDISQISENLLAYHRNLTDESFIFDLTASNIFYNSTTIKVLECKLGLDINQSYSSLVLDGLPKSDPSVLRDKQFDDYAAQLTSSAIKKIHACEYQEAEKKLNDALSFSPENVDAIVALGACKANQKQYSSAIKIFTSALEINPTHKNALNYLVEAGLSEAKIYESNEDWLEASKCYQNILNVTYIKNSPDLLNKITQSLNESLKKQQGEAVNEPTEKAQEIIKPLKTPQEIVVAEKEEVKRKRPNTETYIPPAKRAPPAKPNEQAKVSQINNTKLKHFSSKDLELLNNILSRK